MKKILVILHLLFFVNLAAQQRPTKTQWQQDLRFLQNAIHKDYPFLFVKTTKDTFDAEVESLYKEIPNLEDHEIVVGLSRIIALFKYGHMAVDYNHKPFEFQHLPFNLYQYADGVYIQGVHKDYKQALGAKVKAINKVPVMEALQKIYPVVSAENTQFFKGYGINHLTIPEVLHAQGITDKLQNAVELSLEKDDKSFKTTFMSLGDNKYLPTQYGLIFQDENWLEARDQKTTPLYLKHIERIYFFEYLSEEKSLYVRLSQIEDDPKEKMSSFYARLFDFIEDNKVEKLILDVRLNGGGNNYKNRPLITGIIENKKINKVGKLFVIIGRRTFSACQNLVNELHNYTNAIFVGEPTAENVNFYGDSGPLVLPNTKLPVYLSFAWWQDKAAWENAEWLAPAIPVEMTFEEYSTNQDPVLDAALAFSDPNFQPNPMRYLTDGFVSGDIEELAVEVPKMIKDPKYNFFDFETELTKAGLHLVNSGRMPAIQTGIGVLSFVSQLFPNSAKAWKNLAVAQIKADDKKNAIEALNKAISFDSNGDIGKSAQEMLKEIRIE
ncbi:S41 family peptidase [Poritiphilus flavus]|uniref:Tail specific protease domain-containing protein n=1 Tax=Poritiphilus flavus TaxID=2697053 RepID=A0A6L9EFF1_9FLAO|nr:S41 family peptidase [Poritiphilus flavus]NAS13009.1 hypothetical protein [Poritiphilus flavus]